MITSRSVRMQVITTIEGTGVMIKTISSARGGRSMTMKNMRRIARISWLTFSLTMGMPSSFPTS
jgi:hypothetical protein